MHMGKTEGTINFMLLACFIPLAAWVLEARYKYTEQGDAFFMLFIGIPLYLLTLVVSIPLLVWALRLHFRTAQRSILGLVAPAISSILIVGFSLLILPIIIGVSAVLVR